jgi:hypothetical protein
MPAHADLDRLRALKWFPQLIAYLRDELDWPVDGDAVEDDLTFQYAAEELGFDAASACRQRHHISHASRLTPRALRFHFNLPVWQQQD